MTTILVLFIYNFLVVFLITPFIRSFGIKTGAIDMPDDRKIHESVIPRTGGLSLFFSFLSSIILILLINTNVSRLFVFDKRTMFFLSGAGIVFGIGLIDDFRRVIPSIKLLFQISGASLAFLGGISIDAFSLMGINIYFGPLNFFLTLFWFLLFINAINLIDGLDGLATGIVMFVSLLMTISLIIGNTLLEGMLFAGIAGSTLAFLLYNFKPASIFLGDGGSYFLGYMLAGLSIIGSAKSQISAAFLIPLIALGVPLFDTILSPLRRFAIGKKMFYPDGDHLHHRLLKLGLSQRTAVLTIYGVTIILCASSILLVNLRNEMIGFFMLLLGAAAVMAFRILGYSDYFVGTRVTDRISDLSDDIGLSGGRRSFSNFLNEIVKSENLESLWKNATQVLELLEFDKGSLYLDGPIKQDELKEKGHIVYISERPERRSVAPLNSSVILRRSPPELDWVRPPFVMENYICSRSILRIELPLTGDDNTHFGTLVLVKDMKIKPINHQTLRRVEDLRRTVIRKMEMMAVQSISHPEPSQSKESITTREKAQARS
ncbi:MAG: MraY family glycosyltransferase [Spirochaetota bacterium]